MLDDETDPAPPRVEVCGCTQSEVYRKALEDLAEKLERAAEIAPTPVRNFCSINAEFARSALASVAAPGGKPSYILRERVSFRLFMTADDFPFHAESPVAGEGAEVFKLSLFSFYLLGSLLEFNLLHLFFR